MKSVGRRYHGRVEVGRLEERLVALVGRRVVGVLERRTGFSVDVSACNDVISELICAPGKLPTAPGESDETDSYWSICHPTGVGKATKIKILVSSWDAIDIDVSVKNLISGSEVKARFQGRVCGPGDVRDGCRVRFVVDKVTSGRAT
jgi:hypothetical protein